MTLNITSWTNTEIVVSGFTGSYGSGNWKLNSGDIVDVQVWNAQSGEGPSICSRIVNDQTAKLCSSLEPQVQSVNISGIWKEANTGYVYKINQTSNEFTWAVVSPIRESARGSISGNLVVATYNGDNGVATVPGIIVLDNRNRASEIRWNNGAVFRRQ